MIIPSLPIDFSPHSRLWIFQCERTFTEAESEQIQNQLQAFVKQWKSHADQVKGFAAIFFNQFIVLMADESTISVSGCSTDSAINQIRDIESRFQVSLFNRQQLAFYHSNDIQIFPLQQLNEAIQKGHLSLDSLYFNNTVLTKQEFEEKWIILLKNSWLNSRINMKYAEL